MIIFSRFDASFPVNGAKNVKNFKKCQLTEYIDIALSDLVKLALMILDPCASYGRNGIFNFEKLKSENKIIKQIFARSFRPIEHFINRLHIVYMFWI